jgi:hypothetical protein
MRSFLFRSHQRADESDHGLRLDTPKRLRHPPRMRSIPFAAALCAASVWAQSGEPVADFKLRDHNANSVRHWNEVSPRDYLMRVSAYYFGDAG